ncbi:plasmid partitioning protein RepB C-terminal domain-containing protein [Phaeobacter sp. B1627]|uniref:plasmid partitioning protein RepB C-terminal domain-containing protein n=1 Tax=Phaeobacter sp. B1627 TaxID=2583809 RepID=UPI00159EC79E
MAPLRQVEAAYLMIGQNNFSSSFAKALLAATPDSQRVRPSKQATPIRNRAVSLGEMARMEHELASLQSQLKVFERYIWSRHAAPDCRARFPSQADQQPKRRHPARGKLGRVFGRVSKYLG